MIVSELLETQGKLSLYGPKILQNPFHQNYQEVIKISGLSIVPFIFRQPIYPIRPGTDFGSIKNFYYGKYVCKEVSGNEFSIIP